MSELSKGYDPSQVEDKWYALWLEQGCFKADPARVSGKRPAYSIVIPPPNVTGMLTMGHVLNNTIQDILARKARMDGKEVLWLPGTDHAGIATQTVVERTLKKAGEIKHRNDLGRDQFLKKVWQWKEKHGGMIIQQLKKLGASCDWSRERFTMDPEYSRCVQQVFVDLYKKGHIPTAICLSRENFEHDFEGAVPILMSSPTNALIVYCADQSCDEGVTVARSLVEMGFKSTRLFKGGWKAWKDARLPVEL